MSGLVRPAPAVYVAAALLLAAAAYVRSLRGEFQFDDSLQIETSSVVRRLAFGDLAMGWLDGGRPITALSFAVNYAAGRLDPFGYHLVNVAIHLTAAALLFAFARRIVRLAGARRADWIAAAATAAFALHPLQTEAVSYLSQRAESLSSAFYLAALLLFLAAERHGLSWRGATAYGGAFFCFVLAMGSKPVAITMPFALALVALALRAAPAARSDLTTWKRRAVLLAPFAAFGAICARGILGSLRGSSHAGFDIPGITSFAYLMSEARAVVTYLRLLVRPAGQSVDWQFRLSSSLAEPAVWASGSFLLALLASSVFLLVRAPRRDGDRGGTARLCGLGILWFFLLLSPTSSVVPLADVLVEHRVYLASFGPFLAFAAVAERVVPAHAVWGRRAVWSRRAAAFSLLAVMSLLAALTHRRNAVWKTGEALWRDVLEKAPGNGRARAHISLGHAFASQGRHGEAIAQYEAALRTSVDDPVPTSEALLNLSASQMLIGRTDEALVSLRRGLALRPDDPDLLVNFSMATLKLGDPATAESYVRRALDLAPAHPGAWNVRGAVLITYRDYEGALRALDRATSLNPDLGEAQLNRATALEALGRKRESCAALREALAGGLLPDHRREAQRLVLERCR